MKYIRTEDGIYQFENNENICKKDNELFEIQRFFQPIDHINYKLLGNIIQEADTIEELCDGFMLESAKGFPVDYKKFRSAKKAKERITLETTLYGFIHVRHKGLIYVAKMNNEGVLELI